MALESPGHPARVTAVFSSTLFCSSGFVAMSALTSPCSQPKSATLLCVDASPLFIQALSRPSISVTHVVMNDILKRVLPMLSWL